MSSPSPQLPPSSNEELRTAFSMFMGGLAALAADLSSRDHNQTTETLFIFNPSRGSVMVIQGDPGLFEGLGNKAGPAPASKASIEAMPAVKITEEGAECAICLTEYELGDDAKEMPCKHRYHSNCIDKWLGIHGTCPICRYKMPVDEEEDDSKGAGGGEEDRGERRDGGGITGVTLFVERVGSRDSNSESAPGSDSANDSVTRDGDAEEEGNMNIHRDY